MKFSTQQQRILAALSVTLRGNLPTDFLLSVVLRIPHRNLAAGNPPATGSQRASFSRSLTRLERDGLVCRPAPCRLLMQITDAGREVAKAAPANKPEPRSQLLTAGAWKSWFGTGTEKLKCIG